MKNKKKRPKPTNVLIGVDYAVRPSISVVSLNSKKDGPIVTVMPSTKEPECFVVDTVLQRELVANKGQLQYFGEALIELADCPSFTKREKLLLEAAMDGAVSGALDWAAKKTRRGIMLNGEERARITRKVMREMEKARFDHHQARNK